MMQLYILRGKKYFIIILLMYVLLIYPTHSMNIFDTQEFTVNIYIYIYIVVLVEPYYYQNKAYQLITYSKLYR